MFFVTARITISLPFRTSIKEGDIYDAIEKKVNNTARLKIYPLEYAGTITPRYSGNYVSDFRKIRDLVKFLVEIIKWPPISFTIKLQPSL